MTERARRDGLALARPDSGGPGALQTAEVAEP